jgi:hypothetical protein
LERNSALDYHHRPTSAQVSVAELYHENSKLFPALVHEIAIPPVEAEGLRAEFVRRRSVAKESSGFLPLKLEVPCRELLSRVAAAMPLELFYAIELRVVYEKALAIFDPLRAELDIVKWLAETDLSMLREAVALHEGGPVVSSGALPVLVLVVGSFSRNEILLGVRGYRRTLIEAGRVEQEAVRQSAALHLGIHAVHEFDDRRVDAVGEVDGVEQGTVVILQVGGLN